MILRGILDRSLSSQLCIRGFAPIKELARISKADYSYQRNPIYEQEKTIQTFLDEEEYLFFPEVILSYKIQFDSSKSKDSLLTPIQLLEKKGSLKSNVDKTQLKVKKISYKGKEDIRSKNELKIVDLMLDDDILNGAIEKNLHPFHRVDGNHRLKAAEVAVSDKVNNMVVPFCIIINEAIISDVLQPDGTIKKGITNSSDKFERAVFHNINTKTVPLTSEENLKVILDDNINFPDEELKNNFGWEFLATRKVYKDLPINIHEVFPNLGKAFLNNPRTLSKEIIRILKEEKKITQSNFSAKKVKEALQRINHIWGNNEKLQEALSIGFVTAALFLQIAGYDVELYIRWLITNHIVDIGNLTPRSLIDIYMKIRETKAKQIFVSMQFDAETKQHYEAIKKAVDEINSEYRLDIKLREIRIDTFDEGHSYKIDDKILELIEDCGLLIADITSKNINVYQELGYLMGLNQGKGLGQSNFIIIKKKSKNGKYSDVGFNIRPFQQLRFSSDLELVGMLKKSIKIYYEIN